MGSMVNTLTCYWAIGTHHCCIKIFQGNEFVVCAVGEGDVSSNIFNVFIEGCDPYTYVFPGTSSFGGLYPQLERFLFDPLSQKEMYFCRKTAAHEVLRFDKWTHKQDMRQIKWGAKTRNIFVKIAEFSNWSYIHMITEYMFKGFPRY